MKRIKVVWFALLLAVILLPCVVDNDNNGGDITPLPPDKPEWYTPAPTADYSEWD